mmetsp:Transcript_18860/g.46733  ORF Transcript_18860/g.46733 Transcript_18860/m.46733 type:complete len:102 (+) Transcript_18860:1223-1528(+)
MSCRSYKNWSQCRFNTMHSGVQFRLKCAAKCQNFIPLKLTVDGVVLDALVAPCAAKPSFLTQTSVTISDMGNPAKYPPSFAVPDCIFFVFIIVIPFYAILH